MVFAFHLVTNASIWKIAGETKVGLCYLFSDETCHSGYYRSKTQILPFSVSPLPHSLVSHSHDRLLLNVDASRGLEIKARLQKYPQRKSLYVHERLLIGFPWLLKEWTSCTRNAKRLLTLDCIRIRRSTTRRQRTIWFIFSSTREFWMTFASFTREVAIYGTPFYP